jgi:AraC-like DNA-binding protein
MALVEQIKYAIDSMLTDDNAREKLSVYLSGQLHYSYAHLSRVFSETTYTSIENFVILRKIERAKELLATTNLTLTEIAYRLNYSSVAHLSGQFKKNTGLTPTGFQRILEKRKVVEKEFQQVMTIK